MTNISQFDENFRMRVAKEIREIEKNTQAEVVVIVRARSSTYYDVSLWAGFVFQLAVLSYLLFTPREYNPYWICFAGVVSFVFGFFFTELVAPFKRLLTPRKRRGKNVEIYARAIFQKAGICHTAEHTGLLIFVSLFERQVFLVPDKGLLLKIPEHLWQTMTEDFNSVFKSNEMITDALLSKLAGLRAILAQYVPPVQDDINELPDDLEADL